MVQSSIEMRGVSNSDEEDGGLRVMRGLPSEPKICGVPKKVFYFMMCGLIVCASVGAGIGVALEPSGKHLKAMQGDSIGAAQAETTPRPLDTSAVPPTTPAPLNPSPIPSTTPTSTPSKDPPEVKTYVYLPYDQIVARLLDLQSRFPKMVEVYTTQERYGLGTRGTCFIEGSNQGCKVYVIRIANKELVTSSTPEVFFSGTLHGNERVGPTAVTEFATYLLEMYDFEPWAKRLVDTRAITIVPAANAWGYSTNWPYGERTELEEDPNRDFAWNQSPNACFKTIAAQSINEIWRNHLFQLSITFHGGAHMVAYPWGDFLHCDEPHRGCTGGWTAPDETGMKVLVSNIKSFVGSFNSGRDGYYEIGNLNDIIYAVNGGMEDWAYGASWETGGSVACNPGGYSTSKSSYNNVTHRGINLLVETSNDKHPSESKLGKSADVLTIGGGTANDGYVPRNMRLCWLLTDVVQPWLTIINTEELPSEISEGVGVSVKWEAGGSFLIDQAEIICLDSQGANKCNSQQVQNLYIWDGGAKRGTITTEFSLPSGSGLPSGTNLQVKIRMKVDSGWRDSGRDESFKGPPQSHFVRSRSDPSWYAATGNSVIQGHDWWYSDNQVLVKVVGRRRGLRGLPLKIRH